MTVLLTKGNITLQVNFVISASDSELSGSSVTKVIVMLDDVNDESPEFVFPPYPDGSDITSTYFGAISLEATPMSRVLTLNVRV